MSKTSTAVTLGLIGVGVYALSKAADTKKAINSLRITNPKVSNFKLGLLKTTFNLSLDIVNPSSTTLPFEYYYGAVGYQNTKLADFSYSDNGKNIQLKGRSSTPLTFEVQVSNPALATKLVQLIQKITSGVKIDSVIHVTSTLSAAGVDVPFEFQYDIKTQQTISGIGKRGGFFKKLRRFIVPPHMRLIKSLHMKARKKVLAKIKAKKEKRRRRFAPLPTPAAALPVVLPQSAAQAVTEVSQDQARLQPGSPFRYQPGGALYVYQQGQAAPVLYNPSTTTTATTVTAQNMAIVNPVAAENYAPGVPTNTVRGIGSVKKKVA